MAARPFELAFYEDESGDQPCLRWLRESLSLTKRQALGYAMERVLQQQGKDVCRSDWGRDLGAVFEFKLSDPRAKKRAAAGAARKHQSPSEKPRQRQGKKAGRKRR